MQQVPLIIGNGRIARHFGHYFDLLGVTYLQWDRKNNSGAELDQLLANSTQILLLISDRNIDQFIEENLQNTKHQLIHFSGSYNSKYAVSCHPLQTFADELYNLEDYKKIPFIADTKNKIFPYLPNKQYHINKNEKAYYHALCVIANNFTTLLWQKFYREMETRFNIEAHDLAPILERTFLNIKANPKNSLTGPIARGDVETISENLKALEGDKFLGVYEAFLRTTQHLE
jgi:hypothetical protein